MHNTQQNNIGFCMELPYMSIQSLAEVPICATIKIILSVLTSKPVYMYVM